MAGAIIGSALIGAIGADRAADRQADAAQQAQQVSEEMTAPFREAGQQVMGPLTDLALQGPQLDLTRAEGFREIQNAAAARGKLHSGGTLTELVRFNNMLNEQKFNQRFSALFDIARMGSNAASGQATNSASLLTQAGNAQAAGIAGIANAGQNAISNFAFLPMFQAMRQNPLQGGGG